MNKQALIEALKELGRVLLFAAVSWGISYLGSLPQNESVMIGTVLLKALDKYIHKNENMRANGLAPF